MHPQGTSLLRVPTAAESGVYGDCGVAIGFGDAKLEVLKPLVGVAATGDVRPTGIAAAGVYEEGAEPLLPAAAAPPQARP